MAGAVALVFVGIVLSKVVTLALAESMGDAARLVFELGLPVVTCLPLLLVVAASPRAARSSTPPNAARTSARPTSRSAAANYRRVSRTCWRWRRPNRPALLLAEEALERVMPDHAGEMLLPTTVAPTSNVVAVSAVANRPRVR